MSYGPEARNYLDIHLPHKRGEKIHKKAPVVVFFTGGAWIIGYKAWNLFVTPQLNAAGIIVVSPDYRNFPQGTASDIIQDGNAAMAWIKANISNHGGDASDITLVGQSAGAWLATMMILQRAAEEKTVDPGWSCADVKRVVGISGPYDIGDVTQVQQFHERGLYKSVLYAIFEGELSRWSPTRFAMNQLTKEDGEKLPPFILMHGARDKTVPVAQTPTFAAELRKSNVKVEEVILGDKTHTDGIIEDAMLECNPMMNTLVLLVLFGTTVDVRPAGKQLFKSGLGKNGWANIIHMYPRALIQLARAANPF